MYSNKPPTQKPTPPPKSHGTSVDDIIAALEKNLEAALVEALAEVLASAPCWCNDCKWYTYDEKEGGSVCTNNESDWAWQYPMAHCSCEHCQRRRV